MRGIRSVAAVCLAGAALAGCVTPPSAPSVLALPGKDKSFTQFQIDDGNCRNYAQSRIGPITPGQAATNNAVGGAAVGTLLGAAAGAAIGAAAGNAGAGAAIGAGSGLVLGTGAGASNAAVAGGDLQRQYDFAYLQCMTANGNNVQTAGAYPSAYPGAYATPYAYPYAYPYVSAPVFEPSFGFEFGGGYWGHHGWRGRHHWDRW